MVPQELTYKEIRESLLSLSLVVTTQTNLSMMSRSNIVVRSMNSRLRDFVRINPQIFVYSKVEEDPQEFLDGVYKVLSSMGVISSVKA